MLIKKAEFIKSSSTLSQAPAGNLPEFAFVGRSNVGKSSLINMICNRKNLAKTSSTPGKTQLINHFLINDSWYLVDLPGYGYARSSKEKKQFLIRIIKEYILFRETMHCLFLLIDSRLQPQSNDLEFIHWLGENKVPFTIVFTKCDKLNYPYLQKKITLYKQELLKTWEILPPVFITSSLKKTGREEIIEFIDRAIVSSIE